MSQATPAKTVIVHHWKRSKAYARLMRRRDPLLPSYEWMLWSFAGIPRYKIIWMLLQRIMRFDIGQARIGDQVGARCDGAHLFISVCYLAPDLSLRLRSGEGGFMAGMKVNLPSIHRTWCNVGWVPRSLSA